MYFALSPKYSLFACRLNEWSSAFPQLSSSRAVGILAVAAWETAWGRTPLHDAARRGKVEAAELLLSKGAAVDATNNNGAGPQSGKQGQKSIPSRAWGTSEDFPGLKFEKKTSAFSANVWQSCEFPHQKMPGSMITKCNMPIMCGKRMIWLADGTQIARWHFQESCKAWGFQWDPVSDLGTHRMNMCFLWKVLAKSGFDTKFWSTNIVAQQIYSCLVERMVTKGWK